MACAKRASFFGFLSGSESEVNGSFLKIGASKNSAQSPNRLIAVSVIAQKLAVKIK